MYLSGEYLRRTGGTWHLEDAGFKARYILEMLRAHPELEINSICEIGCGAGGILAELQRQLPPQTHFVGYEISPQAHEISSRFENERCRFTLGDAFADGRTYDLALAIDVVEHVEDCFDFLRRVGRKARFKLYHIPLDAHVSSILRGANGWDNLGHLHLFTLETALKSVVRAGQRVIDHTLTAGVLETPQPAFKRRCANLLRRPAGAISPRFAARLFGGYSVLVLAA